MSVITKIKKDSNNTNINITTSATNATHTKDVNYACICNNYFTNSLKVIVLYPCSHILHSTCYKKTIKSCPFCNDTIKSIIHEDDLYKGTFGNQGVYRQMLIDLESTRLDSSKSFIHYQRLPINIIKFTSFINKLLLATEEADLVNSVDFFFNFTNIKINVIDNTIKNPIIYTLPTNNRDAVEGCGGGEEGCGCGGGEEGRGRYITWKNKVDKNNKKILIVNHSHYLDSFILYYLFRTGFVASEFINKLDLGRLIAQKCKLLIFKRGTDTNMVNKIKEYLEEKRNIVIYPEGSMGGNDTLRKFRTGAFYADAYICPIVIKYSPFVWDDDYKTFILKLISQKEIVVNVYINDLHAPPFTVEQITKIRQEMIDTADLKDSRVSNRNFKD
jgi:1-acyl-sn-glycerol-3-phosphate acyltransferase